MNPFKVGDRVKMLDGDRYAHGEVTIIRGNECKVLFDEEWAPDYWYYPYVELELDVKSKTKEKK